MIVALVVAAGLRDGRGAEPLPGPTLRDLGRQRGLRIGTAVRAGALADDKAYRQLVAAQFSSVTPENEMKWALVEPERGKFRFQQADRIVDAARAAGQAVRGHTLLYHRQLPNWLVGLGRAHLRAATKEHVRRVVGHYRGRVAVWDVVNEVIGDRGGLRRSPFAAKLGAGYIAQAFRVAHRADPAARLHINEAGAEAVNPRSDRLYALVRSLKARGVPIDGVGLQMHVDRAGVPPSFGANLRRFAALGVELAITEADVALRLPAGAADLRAQAGVYRTIVRRCRAVKACKSITFWGFTDGRSWIPETRAGFGAATLLDERLRPKPALGAVQRALGG